jgi:membrane protein
MEGLCYFYLKIIRKVLKETGRQRLSGLATEMAYSNLLALFPAIIAGLTLIGSLNLEQNKVDFLSRQLLTFAPQEVLNLIDEFLEQIRIPQGREVFSLSFFVALWIASGAINTAMNALDCIYEIPVNQRQPFWKAKLISLILTAGTIILIFIASFLVFVSDLLLKFFLNLLKIPSKEILLLWNFSSWIISLMILALTFALFYRYGASCWQKGTPLLPGAIFAALLWAMISKMFRLYVSHFGQYNLTYGALGTGIVLLLWLYLSSLAMLIGVQLNVTVGEAIHCFDTKDDLEG